MKFSNHILFLYFLKSSINPTSPLFVSMYFKYYSLYYLLPARASEQGNWASEANPTLGCSIEISRDIYIAYYTSKSGIWLVIS